MPDIDDYYKLFPSLFFSLIQHSSFTKHYHVLMKEDSPMKRYFELQFLFKKLQKGIHLPATGVYT